MTKYQGTLSFESERDIERLEKYLALALEKAQAEGIRVKIKPQARAGAKAPVEARVIRWLKKQDYKTELTPTQCAKDIGAQQSTVWRIFKRLAETQTLTEVARESGPARYMRTQTLISIEELARVTNKG